MLLYGICYVIMSVRFEVLRDDDDDDDDSCPLRHDAVQSGRSVPVFQ